jgi:hypothetical protein
VDALLALLSSFFEPGQGRPLVLFLIFFPLFVLTYWMVRRGMPLILRSIPSYDLLKGLLAQAAEAGRPVHLSVGIAGIGDQFTADTMAGLTFLEFLADRAAVSASPPIVTLAHPTVLPVALDLVRRAYRRHGYLEEFDPRRVRWIAPDPLLYTGASPNPTLYASGQNDGVPYAAGTMPLLSRQELFANVMVGRYGDEFLLLAETGALRGLEQVGGTSALRALPFVYTSVAHPLIGEEIYAGGAYLANRPGHLSSLLAQDIMRWLLAGGLVITILGKTAGMI